MSGKTITNLLSVLTIVAAMFFRPVTPDPVSPDRERVESVAAELPAVLARLQADNYTEVVRKLRAKELTGDIGSGDWLRTRNKAAIDAAYTPLDTELQRLLGDGKFTDEAAAGVYEQIAAGFAAAAKGGGK